jgi:predicted esterase YcpF (UPF0227 family)
LILYLHGFNSAPSSHKARTMQQFMDSRGLGHLFNCPALPHHPREAVALIEAAIAGAEGRGLTLVGSSLGGFYATWFAEKYACRAVLVQPAVFPYIGLASRLGPQENLYTRAKYELTQSHVDGWRDLAVDKVDPERYLVLLETGDEILDYREAVRRYEGARMVIREGGNHAMQSFAESLPRILVFAGIGARQP